MAGSDLITIVLVLGIGYYLLSSGKLDEIMGQISNVGRGGSGAPVGDTGTSGGGEKAYAESPGGPEADVSGKNAGAIVNGRCVGSQEQCAKAQELLDDVRNR